jgi:integrase
MEKRAHRQQTTEKIGEPLELGIGRVHIERRNGSPILSARAYIQGKHKLWSTGERDEKKARHRATEQFFALHRRIAQGEHLHGHLFSEAVEKFLVYADTRQQRELSAGQRQQYHIKWGVLKKVLKKHCERDGQPVRIADVDKNFLLNLRDIRADATTQRGTPMKNATIRKDFTFVKLVLQHARDELKWISSLPDFPKFRGEWAVADAPNPFLTYKQYRKLFNTLRARKSEPDLNPRTKRQREELYWFVLICVGAALRVGEAHSLRWRDCKLVTLDDAEQTPAVQMLVHGKHRNAKTAADFHGERREQAHGVYHAVSAFKLMQKARPDAKPDDDLFLENHRDGVVEALKAADLYLDKITGRTRNGRCLRPTGICLRLEVGPRPIDYRAIARWARTSPAMIDRFYDQLFPATNAARIVGFAPRPKKKNASTKKKNTRGKADKMPTLAEIEAMEAEMSETGE